MGATLGVPGVQFPLVGVDGALFFKLEAMNREVSGFLPALNGSDLAPEVGSDFLPLRGFFSLLAAYPRC